MKKLRWVWVALIGAIMIGCSQPEGAYTIKGRFNDLKDTQLVLIVNNQIIDTVEVKDGRFTIRGKVDRPEMAGLYLGPDTPGAMFFIEPGKLTITGELRDFETLTVKGTPLNDKLFGFLHQFNALQNRHMSSAPEDQDRLMAEIDSMKMAFIDSNLDNLAGVLWFVSTVSQSMDIAQIESTIARFTPEMQQSSLMDDARTVLARMVNSSVGSSFTEIAMPDRNGKTITLSEVVGRNKYVLLDFWASWCGPCMYEIPYLKSAYERFGRRGFAIYGVTLDSERSAWINAMDGNGMNWPNVGDFESSRIAAARDYRVVTIPTNFLIARDGTIVARDLRGDALAEKLKELLP